MGAVMGAKPKEPMSDEDSDIAMNDRESFPYHLRPLFESAPGIPGQDELVHFNVSGRTFTTLSTTLNNFPESIFGTKEKRSHLKRTKDGAIFLNRNPSVFKKVLTFYQTGIFEFPEKMNQNIFVQDVSYYGLAKQAISCQIQGFTQEVVEVPTRRWQAKLWRLLEDPDSSTGARVMSFWSIMVILTSIIVFCWETLPGYRENHGRHESRTGDILDQIELACIIWFTLEFVARFALSPNKCTFIKSWLNIIDFVAILPFFITFAGKFEGQVSIYFLRCVRLVRVFRVFKLSRHSVEMKILAIAVKSSARELGVLVFFILLGVLLFSSAVYYAEIGNSETKLKSIPAAFWWAIVSMTTVGYGDVVPITIGELNVVPIMIDELNVVPIMIDELNVVPIAIGKLNVVPITIDELNVVPITIDELHVVPITIDELHVVVTIDEGHPKIT